ncbi:MAG: hypothetical protein ACK5JU_08635 [Bacteroidales bacterium]
MYREKLIQSAGALKQVTPSSATEFGAKREILVARMNLVMGNRPDLIQLVGADNVEMMKDNHANHARFIESIFVNHSP